MTANIKAKRKAVLNWLSYEPDIEMAEDVNALIKAVRADERQRMLKFVEQYKFVDTWGVEAIYIPTLKEKFFKEKP